MYLTFYYIFRLLITLLDLLVLSPRDLLHSTEQTKKKYQILSNVKENIYTSDAMVSFLMLSRCFSPTIYFLRLNELKRIFSFFNFNIINSKVGCYNVLYRHTITNMYYKILFFLLC